MPDLIRVKEYERLFREAVKPGLEVHRNDVRRTIDLVSRKLHDLLRIAEASANEDGRDLMQYADLPVTEGLRRQMYTFSQMEVELELAPIYERLASFQPLEYGYADDLEDALPGVIGGLTVAVARTLRALDTRMEQATADSWDRTERLLDVAL